MNFVLSACNWTDSLFACEFALFLRENYKDCKIGYVGYRTSMDGKVIAKKKYENAFDMVYIESAVEDPDVNVPINHPMPEFEKITGKPSWYYIYCDRTLANKKDFFGYKNEIWHFRTAEECQQVIEKKVNGIMNLFDVIQPDHLLFMGYDVSPVSSLIMQDLQEHYNFKITCPLHSRVNPQTFFNDNIYCNVAEFDKVLKETLEEGKDFSGGEEDKTPINKYHDKFYVPEHKKEKKNLKMKLYRTKRWVQQFKPTSDPYNYNPSLLNFRLEINKLLLKKLNANSLSLENLPEKFIYFPLHQSPEFSTTIYAPYFNDQYYVIECLSKSVPEGYKVLVKEHFTLYIKSMDFFKKILNLPNVMLVKNTVSSEDLIKKAALTAVITGTAGLESVMIGKPAILFGQTYFQNLPGITRVRDVNNLYAIIRDAMNSDLKPQRELVDYVLNKTAEDIVLGPKYGRRVFQDEKLRKNYFEILNNQIKLLQS